MHVNDSNDNGYTNGSDNNRNINNNYSDIDNNDNDIYLIRYKGKHLTYDISFLTNIIIYSFLVSLVLSHHLLAIAKFTLSPTSNLRHTALALKITPPSHTPHIQMLTSPVTASRCPDKPLEKQTITLPHHKGFRTADSPSSDPGPSPASSGSKAAANGLGKAGVRLEPP